MLEKGNIEHYDILNWHDLVNQKKTAMTTREENIHILCCFLQYFPPCVGHFEYFKMLNDAKVPSLGFFI